MPTKTAKTAAKPAAKTTAKAAVKAPAPKAVAAKAPAKVSKSYQPLENEKYMNAKQLAYFRQKLLTWREELLAESQETINNLKEENWREPDLSDRASLETEAGVELRTRNRYLKLIGKIDSAVRRIDDGTYGYCEETGEPIGLKRLEARPIATMTIEAQERHEKMERQYIDEE